MKPTETYINLLSISSLYYLWDAVCEQNRKDFYAQLIGNMSYDVADITVESLLRRLYHNVVSAECFYATKLIIGVLHSIK